MGIKEAWAALWKRAETEKLPPGRPVTESEVALAASSERRPATMEADPANRPYNDPGSQLGPGVPPKPMPLGGEPRQFQYRPGWNIPSSPGEGRISAETLRFFADNYDLLRRCIEVRKSEIKGLEWDIVPMEANKKKSQALRERHSDLIEQIKAFFQYPEAYMAKAGTQWIRRGYVDWDAWIGAVLEEHFVGDWLAIYPRRKLNGEPLRLERIDGSTIKVLLTVDGRTPIPPEPAYNQWLHGRVAAQFTIEELLYKPRNRRNHTPYGYSNVEQILAHINEAIRFQMWTTAYFSDGSIPEGFFTAPEGWNTQQITEFNDYINSALKGDPKALREFHLVPYGSTYLNVKPFTFDDKFARYLAEKTCILMDVQPTEVGWSPQSGLGGSGWSEGQEAVTKRKSTGPLARWLAGVFTEIIHNVFGARDLQFAFTSIQDEDEDKRVATDKDRLMNGQATLDQILQERGEEPVGFNTPMVVAGTQVFFLPDLLAAQKYGASAVTGFGGFGAPGPYGSGSGGRDDWDDDDDDGPKDPPPAGRRRPASDPESDDEPDPQEEGEDAKVATVAKDLARWRRKALKDVKAGKNPRPFKSEAIPADLVGEVSAKLADAQTPDAVKAAFANVARATPRWKIVRLVPQNPAAIAQATARMERQLEKAFRKESEAFADWLIPRVFPEESSSKVVKADAGKIGARLDDYFFTWVDMLIDPLQSQLEKIHGQGMYDVFATLELGGDDDAFQLRNRRAESYARRRGAQLVGKRILPTGEIIDNPNPEFSITESTREMLRGSVARSLEQGLTPDQLREEIINDYAFSPTRANAIATAETAFAYNDAAIEGYRESGVVSRVRVEDGDGCDACKQINGQIWTLEQAKANPLEHPHCKRVFHPIVEV